MKLHVPPPFSGGLFLTYKCPSECRHCMYAGSPRWRDDWIDLKDAEGILAQLSKVFHNQYPPNFRRVGINSGFHFTGGEPFLNFDLLEKLTRMVAEFEIPATFVETSCFWCTDRQGCTEKLSRLRAAGLDGILISVNPFILEHVPLERTELAIEVSRQVFGGNVLVYQESFYERMRKLDVRGTLGLEQALRLGGAEVLGGLELLPMGRVAFRLAHLYPRYPAERFFTRSCIGELIRPWHVHVDNYCNYIPGYCGGISLGDARNLESICEGVELDDRPILKALATKLENLFELGTRDFGYRERPGGYVSACHLCVDIRKHIAQQTDEFRELRPREFYQYL